MFLLVLAGLGILVLEDEMNLGSRQHHVKRNFWQTHFVGGSAFVRAKHDHIGRSVGKLLCMQFLVFAQEFHVGASTFETVLKFDFVLDDEGLALVVDDRREFGRDGVVGSCVLHNKALVTHNSREDSGFFDRPLPHVGPILLALGVLLFGMGGGPSRVPVVGELFEEGSFQSGRLAEV